MLTVRVIKTVSFKDILLSFFFIKSMILYKLKNKAVPNFVSSGAWQMRQNICVIMNKKFKTASLRLMYGQNNLKSL